MRRRALLATVPAVLAGCVGRPPGTAASTTTTTTTTKTTSTSKATTDPDAEFTVTDFAVETETDAPDHRYLVRITKVYSADAVADEPGDPTVVDVSEVEDPDVRAFLKDVLSEGRVRVDAIPEGLRETVTQVDFFTWDATTDPDDTASHWAIEVFETDPDRAPALQFDAELTDGAVSPGDPGAITFSIENVGDTTQQVFSGTVPPFGVLWADATDGDRYLLWRDYEDEGCVSFVDDSVLVCDIGIISEVEPGETIAKPYELRPENPVGAPLEVGEYVVSGTVSYHQQPQGPSTKVEWQVSFRVEEA